VTTAKIFRLALRTCRAAPSSLQQRWRKAGRMIASKADCGSRSKQFCDRAEIEQALQQG